MQNNQYRSRRNYQTREEVLLSEELIEKGLSMHNMSASELLKFTKELKRKIEEDNKMTNTQLRKYYDEIIKIKEKGDTEDYKIRELVMLIAKIHYGVKKDRKYGPLLLSIAKSIEKLVETHKDDTESLNDFFRFMEMIYAYIKKER